VNGHLALWAVDRISFDLPRSPKKSVISALVDVATRGTQLTAAKRGRVLDLLLGREKNGSTAAGGLAIPHVKSPDVKGPLASLGVFPDGIDFDAVDREKVHVVFLLLSPAAMAAEHVAVLRFIAGVARQPDFMPFVRRTRTPAEARALLEEMGA